MKVLTTLLDVVAMALVVTGVWLLAPFAALIVAGLCVGFASWRLTR